MHQEKNKPSYLIFRCISEGGAPDLRHAHQTHQQQTNEKFPVSTHHFSRFEQSFFLPQLTPTNETLLLVMVTRAVLYGEEVGPAGRGGGGGVRKRRSRPESHRIGWRCAWRAFSGKKCVVLKLFDVCVCVCVFLLT